MPRKTQAEVDIETRTRGLTILARILAASLVRKHEQHHESSDTPDAPVGPYEGDVNGPEANDSVGDER
jgi:hypothetical protein